MKAKTRPTGKYKFQGGSGKNLPKNKKLGGGGKKKGGGLRKRASQLTEGVIREGRNDLRQDRNQIRRETRNAVTRANTDYRRGKQDLRHVASETDEFLRGLNSQNEQTYSGMRDRTAQAQAALEAALGSTYDSAQAEGMAELERLGVSQGGNFSGLMQDEAFAGSMARQSGFNAQSTLGQSHTNAQQLGNLLRGMSRGQFQSNMGQQLNNRNDAVNEARQTRQDEFNKVREALSDLRGSRKDLMLQFLTQLNSQRAANMQARASMIQARKM